MCPVAKNQLTSFVATIQSWRSGKKTWKRAPCSRPVPDESIPVMIVDNLGDDRETQTDPFLLRSEKRIENLLAKFRRARRDRILEIRRLRLSSRNSGAMETRNGSADACHRLVSVHDQINEDSFAQLIVGLNLGTSARTDARDDLASGRGAWADARRSTRAGICTGRKFDTQRAGEIEKTGDERLRRLTSELMYPASSLASGFESSTFAEHFGGAFDDAERVANFVSEACGELSEGGETFGAAGIGFGAAQLAIGFLEAFGELLVLVDLLAIFQDESVHHDGGEIKEKDADREVCCAFGSELIFLKGWNEIGAVGQGGDSGPEERPIGPK